LKADCSAIIRRLKSLADPKAVEGCCLCDADYFDIQSQGKCGDCDTYCSAWKYAGGNMRFGICFCYYSSGAEVPGPITSGCLNCTSPCKAKFDRNSIGVMKGTVCECSCKPGYSLDKSGRCSEITLIEQLEKEYNECNDAVIILKTWDLTPLGGQRGSALGEGVSYNFVYGQEQAMGMEVFSPRNIDNVDGPLYMKNVVDKWLYKSGCGAHYDPAICVSRHCIDVVGESLKKAGGTLPSDEAIRKQKEFFKKVGSVILDLFPGAVRIDKGAVYVKSVGTSAVVLRNGAVYFHSEGVVEVDENGTARIYLIDGNATYIGFSNATQEVYYYIMESGEKMSVSSAGVPSNTTNFDDTELDRWWGGGEICPGVSLILFVLLASLGFSGKA